MRVAQASRIIDLDLHSRLGKKAPTVHDSITYSISVLLASILPSSRSAREGIAGKMADPRQMWENLQKGLARAQQSGQRLVYTG
jgi:hypothetical protein